MKPTSFLLTCLIGLAVPKVCLAQPAITTQPQSQTNIVGTLATFSVEATSALPIFFQWQKAATDLTGETNNILVLTNVQTGNAGSYSVVVSNAEGAVTSVVATVTVLLPPRILPSTSLQSKAAYVGTRASFTVATTGIAPLSFQWRLDGRELVGQTNRTLTLNTVQPADEGDYTVMATNAGGAAVSDATRLYVVPASTNSIFRNFTNAAGLRLPYYYFLPSNYDPARTYPLVCHLHSDETVLLGFSNGNAPPETLVFGSYRQQATDPVIMIWPARRAGDGEWTSQYLQQVSGLLDWMLLANNAKGTSTGTNAWNAMSIPLQANRTNMIVVLATTTSWAPAFGGNTTFNDTLAVICLPLRATLALQASGATLNWTGGVPPYHVQRATDLTSGNWMDVLTNAVPPVTLNLERRVEFYRIVGQ